MLQQLQAFFHAPQDQNHSKNIEASFDAYFCQNSVQAANEAIAIITDSQQHQQQQPQPPLPAGIRLLAANFLLKFITDRWRVPAGAANAEMRQAQITIRQSVLAALSPDPSSATDAGSTGVIGHKSLLRKFAMCLAKITRYEFPGLWPNGGPFPQLVDRVLQLSYGYANNANNSSGMALLPPSPQRAQALFVLHLVLKEVYPLVNNQRAQGAVVEAARCARGPCHRLLGDLFSQLVSNSSRALVDWIGIPQPHQQLAPKEALLVLEIKTLAKIMLRCAVQIDLDADMVLTFVHGTVALADIAIAQQRERDDESSENSSPFKGIPRDEDADEDAVVLMERFSKVVTVATHRRYASMPDLRPVVAFLLSGMKQQLSDSIFSRCATCLHELLMLCGGDGEDARSDFSPPSASSSSSAGGGGGGGGGSVTRKVHVAVTGVLSPEAVTDLVRDLITRFLRDDQNELRTEWTSDPERYVLTKDEEANSEENEDGAEQDPSIVAEHFFMALAGCEWPGVVDVIWQVLTDALNSPDASFVAGALHAVGLGFGSLATEEQFDQFMIEKLVPALLNPAEASPLVLRRVVWVIGMWCDSISSPFTRRRLFETFGSLLQARPHAVVALTLFRALSHLMADDHFRGNEDQIAGQPLAQILAALKEMLVQARAAETVENLTGIISMITDSVTPKLGEEALQIVRAAAPYGVLLDSLEGFIRRAAEKENSDNHQCAAAVMLIHSLASAFRVGLLSGEESGRAVQLTLACTDRSQVIHVWTQEDAWEALPGFFFSPSVPAPIASHVFGVAQRAAERIFDGRKDAVLILAFVTLFYPGAGEAAAAAGGSIPMPDHLNAQYLGTLAMNTIRESDPNGQGDLMHNALLLLEATTRRFPGEKWSQLAASAFSDFGNCNMDYRAALLAVALSLCFERDAAAAAGSVLPPNICGKFVDKAVEASDMLPNDYAKVLLLQGLQRVCQASLFDGGRSNDEKLKREVSASLDALRQAIAGDQDMVEQAKDHWSNSQAAAEMLVVERR